MRIEIPEFSMVALIGPSGCGKSTFCAQHFAPTEVLSSDTYRGLVCDDEESQSMTPHAFEALHYMLNKRLELGRLTVVDATNVTSESRAALLKIANRWHALRIAIVLDVSEETCHERNVSRPNRQFGPHVVKNHRRDLRRFFGSWKKEGWTRVFVLKPEELADLEIVRTPLFSRRHEEHGPFDIIGDIHACSSELFELLGELGWTIEPELKGPEGRKLIFLGDLVDRGPDPVGVLRFVMDAVKSGQAICVPGNHDIKLVRALKGAKVTLNHGLKETMEALKAEPDSFREDVREFLHGLTSHFLLDDGKLCVAHAGMRADMMGRGSGAVREFALYGETTGEIDEFGLPVRYQWADDYRGDALVVYGHTPVPRPEWINGTIDIDTGCCFGGKLTALRYPERELVSVPAHETYAEPARPIQPVFEPSTDTVLHLSDVTGRRVIETRLAGRITVREENAIAALEVMSRFATDPRWLVYLPPTMSPCKTSDRKGFLEYPTEAFQAFFAQGVTQVVCEEKHMGSRAVCVVCRSAEVARERFGVDTGEVGVITSRTGRRFFDDPSTEAQILSRVQLAAEKSGLWDELATGWLLIDLELMPWSAKAVSLLKSQYAPVGAAAMAAGTAWGEILEQTAARGIELGDVPQSVSEKRDAAEKFVAAYRRYCWPVRSLDDYKLAPFHLLASEGAVHTDKDHLWHMEMLGRLCDADPAIFRRTPHRLVNLESEEEMASACQWWEDLVRDGGEGMVVKPLSFLPGSDRAQPAMKCRGPEYLRIIYGPEYLRPANLSRLRKRGLKRKQSLASREFALGIEAMERFVRREPLRRVHECVFGVLAMESEPVDPRL